MSEIPKVSWLDAEFGVYGPSTRWNEVPGVYIFAGVNQRDEWYPLYVGQTQSLARRLGNHDKWLEARRLGATHIHARTVRDQRLRLSLERRLVLAFQPSLNAVAW